VDGPDIGLGDWLIAICGLPPLNGKDERWKRRGCYSGGNISSERGIESK